MKTKGEELPPKVEKLPPIVYGHRPPQLGPPLPKVDKRRCPIDPKTGARLPRENYPLKLGRKHHKLDRKKVIDYVFINKMSHKDVADFFNVPESTIYEICKPYHKILKAGGDGEVRETYARHKAEFLTAVEYKMIEAMADEDKINEAPINQLAYSFGVLSTHNRLEQGKSTANIKTLSSVICKVIQSEDVEGEIAEDIPEAEVDDGGGKKKNYGR